MSGLLANIVKSVWTLKSDKIFVFSDSRTGSGVWSYHVTFCFSRILTFHRNASVSIKQLYRVSSSCNTFARASYILLPDVQPFSLPSHIFYMHATPPVYQFWIIIIIDCYCFWYCYCYDYDCDDCYWRFDNLSGKLYYKLPFIVWLIVLFLSFSFFVFFNQRFWSPGRKFPWKSLASHVLNHSITRWGLEILYGRRAEKADFRSL